MSLCATYDFTLSHEKMPDRQTLIGHLRQLAKKWVFQLEEADGGYVHFQGRMSLFKKKRPGELKKLIMDKHDDLESMHFSPSSNNSLATGECFYVVKSDTRLEGPWSDVTERVSAYIPRQYRGLLEKAWPWQKAVLESRHDFDTRTVNYLFDPAGNNGKSTTASLAELHYDALALPLTYDPKQLLESACDILMGKEQRVPGLCFIDLPRGIDPRKVGAFLIACEEIKKGKVCDMRHRYKEWWFDSPQIWVFANWLPDLNALSVDRWKLWTITDYKLEEYKVPEE